MLNQSVMSEFLRTPWTAAFQVPLSVEFSTYEYWSRLPFPAPGDPPGPGTEPSLGSPALAGGFLTARATREALTKASWRGLAAASHPSGSAKTSLSRQGFLSACGIPTPLRSSSFSPALPPKQASSRFSVTTCSLASHTGSTLGSLRTGTTSTVFPVVSVHVHSCFIH